MSAARARLARPTRTYPFLHEWHASRYPAAYLRSGVLEEGVGALVRSHLVTRYRARVTVIDSGDRRLRGRLVSRFGVRGTALNGLGGTMERGIADLAVTFPGGRSGWFELKKPARLGLSRAGTGRLVVEAEAGAPTPEQLEFLEEQRRAGAIVAVVWHPLDVDEAVGAAGGST